MPRNDNTGPEGRGPMTGRGLGNCNPDNKSDENDTNRLGQRLFSRRGLRLGLGRRSGGRGRNRKY